jgi:hypothetical protein
MIGRMVLSLALVCAAGAASAQEAACTLYKVNTSMLNVSKDAGGDIYNDALFDGEVACVTRLTNIKGVDWAYITYKLDKGSTHTPVDGWAGLRYLQQTSPGAGPGAAPAPAASPPAAAAPPPASPPVAAVRPAAPAAPPPAAAPPPVTSSGAVATVRPEDVLRFNQPIPFGPFPVNGHSIQEMIDSTPMFPPIEGLEESLWKKKCTSCHQWNQARMCEQAGTYVKAPKFVLRVQHPFGGTLKLALMRWAMSGCQ